MISLNKIALEIDKGLEILLREYYEYEFINTADYEIYDILKEEVILLIMDDSGKNTGLRLELLKKYNIKVLLLSSDFDIQVLRKYIRENLIFDFLKKKDYQLIEEIVDFVNTLGNVKNKFYIDTSSMKVLIEPDDILYVGYSKVVRKAVIKTTDQEYFTTRHLFEIEELLSEFAEFVRIERSNIVNINRISGINFKEEMLIFDNNEILQLSRRILKKLETFWINSEDVIKL